MSINKDSINTNKNMCGESREQQWLDYLWLGVILCVGLVIRLHFLWATEAGIESDEAIVGLMAKHMAEGRSWPVFYYGQNYLGSLEAILTSFVFRLIGVSNFGLKCVPLIFSLFHIIVVYELIRLLSNKCAARIGALCVAIPPSALLVWSLKARGGFIELVVIGTLSLILSVKLLSSCNPNQDRHKHFQPMSLSGLCGLGVLLGLGWWTNNQIIYYMAAIGSVFFVYILFRGGFLEVLKSGSVGLAGFVLGSAPFWYVNLFTKPRFATFVELGKRAESDKVIGYFQGFWAEALPILFGARRLWNDQDVFYGASTVAYVVYLICLVATLVAWSCGLRASKVRVSVSVPSIMLVCLFCVFIQIIFSISGFGWLTKEPRYLLPIYSVQFLFVGVAVSWMYGVTRLFWVSRIFPNLVLVALLGLHLSSSYGLSFPYYNGLAIPGEPFIGSEGDRVQSDHKDLYSWLAENHYRHIFTNYWIGYRVAFETLENVTFTRFRQPRSLRIPEYEEVGFEYRDNSVYVLGAKEAEMVARAFRDSGLVFRTTEVSGYIILDHLRPITARGNEISLSNAKLRASSRDSWLENVIDNDISTRWGSGMAQNPNMFVEVELPVNTAISGIDIDMGLWPQDVAARLVIEATDENGKTCVLFDRTPDLELVCDHRTLEINFPVITVEKIKFFQTAHRAIFDWSMADIRLYEPSQN